MTDNGTSANTVSPGDGREPVRWFVYIIRTAANRLYTGITTNPARRFCQHETGRGGAKYFRLSRPVQMVYLEECDTRSTASRLEAVIKRMGRADKLTLIARGGLPAIENTPTG